MIPTALVTGGNRGIGVEICRQLLERGHRVVLTARDPAAAERAAGHLEAHGPLLTQVLDVTDPASVTASRERLRSEGVDVDVLVNNAAVYPRDALLEQPLDAWERTLRTNVTGPLLLCQAFLPTMLERDHGRIVNVSSGSGSFGEGLYGPAAYCVSKAALNALTVKLAEQIGEGTDVLVNAVCPGWVATDMGGAEAPRTPAEGARGIVRLATLPRGGPTGRFFRDEHEIPW